MIFQKIYQKKKNLINCKKKDLKITRFGKTYVKKTNLLKSLNEIVLKKKIPWLLPVFVNNSKLRKKIFNFGWKNGFSIISWPTLPKQLVNKENKKIWSKLVCFETDRAPNNQNIDFDIYK